MAQTFNETDLLLRIGNTPLVFLSKISQQCPGVQIYAKAEYFNPGGSVKDRPALNMILEGKPRENSLLEKFSWMRLPGNTGIAYAMIGAIAGSECVWQCQKTFRSNDGESWKPMAQN